MKVTRQEVISCPFSTSVMFFFFPFSKLYFQIHFDTIYCSRERKGKKSVFPSPPWCIPSTHPEGRWAISCYQLLWWRPFCRQQTLPKEYKHLKHQLSTASKKEIWNLQHQFYVKISTRPQKCWKKLHTASS